MTELAPLRSFPFAAFAGQPVPERQWLVADLMPRFTTTAIYGDGGLGKSLLAMQLMTCCALGKRFLNYDTQPCSSMGIFCEDSEDELHRRQHDLNAHYECGWQDLNDMHAVPRLGENNALVTWQGDIPTVTDLYRQIERDAQEMEKKLVVIDTAADTFTGNENERGKVRYYIQLLNKLAVTIQGSVILLVHPSAAGMANKSGTGGSTAWNNSVRSRLYLTKPDDQEIKEGESPHARFLSHKKSNYSACDPTDIPLIWDKGAYRLRLDDNDFVAKIEKKALIKKIRDVIEHCRPREIYLSDSAHSRNYAPREIYRILSEEVKFKCSMSEVEKQYKSMRYKGELVLTPYGKPSDHTTTVSIAKQWGGDSSPERGDSVLEYIE